MNRVILFRGKRLDNGEWVSGSLLFEVYEDRASIIHYFIDDYSNMGSASYDIDVKTIGQFTGEFDKQGERIFEGDTLDNGYVVQMEDGRWLARKGMSVIEAEWFFNWEIIGTIHD